MLLCNAMHLFLVLYVTKLKGWRFVAHPADAHLNPYQYSLTFSISVVLYSIIMLRLAFDCVQQLL